MTNSRIHKRKLMKDRRAVSPAISTVILTGAVVTLLLVTIVFANNFLNARIAEDEFKTMKQFMQTVGLQMDDVAWMIGRTQTIRYASKFGQVNFQSALLNYTIYVDKGSGYVRLAQNITGVLMFNMPIQYYSIGNNYRERIIPVSDRAFLQAGTSAPVSHVFVIEKIPMNDGKFIRVIVAPSIRMLNSTISTGADIKNYFKFYLPVLFAGVSPHYSQSLTLSGSIVAVSSESMVNRVKITVDFPNSILGFDAGFFGFDSLEQEVDVPNGSIVEFYTSKVTVSLGAYI